MFDREVRQSLQTGALLVLLVVVGACALVFVLTRLEILLGADLATPLVVVGIALFVVLTEILKHQRGQY